MDLQYHYVTFSGKIMDLQWDTKAYTGTSVVMKGFHCSSDDLGRQWIPFRSPLKPGLHFYIVLVLVVRRDDILPRRPKTKPRMSKFTGQRTKIE